MWQYIDTVDECRNLDEQLRALIDHSLRTESDLRKHSMLRELNPTGKLLVNREKLTSVLDFAFPNHPLKRAFVMDRLRRLPEHIQNKVIRRYDLTKDNANVQNKEAWLLGILNNEFKWTKDVSQDSSSTRLVKPEQKPDEARPSAE